MFPFWKLNVFICGFSTKVSRAFLASVTMEKWRFQGYIHGGWILSTSSCVLAWVYIWDSLLIKDIQRLRPIHKYKHQICSTLSEYKCMGRFCIMNFTQFSRNSLLRMKYCSVNILLWRWNPAHDEEVVDFNIYMENKF